jgi:protein-S-isoprenylcysteine O-methyltransferase Ste14
MKILRLLLHIPVPWMYVLAYLLGVCVELTRRPYVPIDPFPGGIVTGGVLMVLGLVIAGWGWITFFRARTTTVPGRTSSSLVTWGPYRFTRNPMYVGLAIAYLGEAGIQRQVWPIAFLPLLLAYVNWVVIPVEEAKLKEVFGDAYDQYRSRVRRWL